MNKKARKLLIVTAIVILVAAALGIVYVVLDEYGVLNRIIKQPTETSAPETSEYIHDDEEKLYNEDGTLSSVVYYKENIFNGRVDYAYFPGKTYIMHYNAENEEYISEKYTYNDANNPVEYTKKEYGTLVESISYVYYDDMTTLKKQTDKTYDSDENESAVKQYFSEAGLLTKKITYENGVSTETILYEYDENGTLLSENTVTGENENENE